MAEILPVVLLGLLLFVSTFGGAALSITTHFLGLEAVDHYGTQWFYWFVGRQLLSGGSVWHTDLLFYPYGKDILLHTGANVLDAALAQPFLKVLGPVAGYNTFLLTGMAFNVWAFQRLARTLTRDPVAQWGSSLLFAFTPYLLIEAAEGRPTQAIVGLLPLFMLELRRSGHQAGRKAPVRAGVLLAVLGYWYWYYALFAGVMALAHGLWGASRACFARSSRMAAGEAPSRSGGQTGGAGAARAILSRHALMAAVAIALCAPVALPLAWKAQAEPETVPGLLRSSAPGQTVTAEGRVQALQVWQPLKGASRGEWTATAHATRFEPGPRLFPAVLLLLVALYLWRPRRLETRAIPADLETPSSRAGQLEPGDFPVSEARSSTPDRLEPGAFLVMVGAMVLLAIGPVLLVGSTPVPNLVYQFLTAHLGLMQRLWWPARASACLALLFAMATAVALARLGRWGRRRQAAALLAVGLAWVLELRTDGLAPFPSWDASVPAGYRWLARGDTGAVIELPYRWTQAHLYYQTLHGRPILGGMLEDAPAFAPPEAVAMRTRNGFMRALLSAATLEAAPVSIPEADRAAVRAAGFRYVVLQKEAYRADTREGLRESISRTQLRRVLARLDPLLGPPVFDDDRTRIYALTTRSEENGD